MRALALALLVWSGSGCAFLNRDNLLLFDAFERHLVPDAEEATAAHVASAPLTYPSGLVLITLDAFLTHPALIVDDSWHDTVDALWDDFDWQEHYVTELTALPFRALGTPLLWLTIFLGRSLFDFPPHGVQPVDVPQPPGETWPQVEARIATLVAAGSHAEALDAVRANRPESDEHQRRWACWGAVCAAGLEDAADCALWLRAAGQLAGPEEATLQGLLRYIIAGPIELRLLLAPRLGRLRPSARTPLLHGFLSDPDAVVRFLALQTLWGRAQVPKDLHESLQTDPSAAVRSLWLQLEVAPSEEDP